jgi:hypothetical protein
MRARLAVTLLFAAGSAACGALFASSDDAPTPATDAGDERPPPVVDAGDEPEVDAAPDTGPPPCEPGATVPATIEADAFLPQGACAGANYFGGGVNMNIAASGVVLVRFGFDTTVETAFAAGKVHSLTLTIEENQKCDSDTTVCLANVPGRFDVRPARTDWVEGPKVFTSYGGADMCRRTNGNPGAGWGANLTADPTTLIGEGIDYGAPVATADVAAGAATLVFAIDGRVAAFPLRAHRTIAFALFGEDGALFVGAQHESVKHPPPKLDVVLCK